MSSYPTATEAAVTPANTIISLDIDPEGDVYLCSDNFKVLVSSKVLSVVSPVFKALLGPHFAEGSQVSSASPGSVSLSEDNPEALVSLCQILHYQFHRVQYDPTLKFINSVAVVADKYDCVRALAQWSTNCLHLKLRNEPSGMGAANLLFSAIFFDSPVIFQEVTKSMIYSLPSSEYGRLLLSWSADTGLDAEDILPKGVIGKNRSYP